LKRQYNVPGLMWYWSHTAWLAWPEGYALLNQLRG
jgi:hypothetical protein